VTEPSDIVVCFITPVPRAGPDIAPIAAATETGLKVASVVRFDKIAAHLRRRDATVPPCP
jgi:hypothetical protein